MGGMEGPEEWILCCDLHVFSTQKCRQEGTRNQLASWFLVPPDEQCFFKTCVFTRFLCVYVNRVCDYVRVCVCVCGCVWVGACVGAYARACVSEGSVCAVVLCSSLHAESSSNPGIVIAL